MSKLTSKDKTLVVDVAKVDEMKSLVLGQAEKINKFISLPFKETDIPYANQLLTEVKTVKKSISDQEKAILDVLISKKKDIDAFQNEVKDYVANIMEPMTTADAMVKQMLMDYQAKINLKFERESVMQSLNFDYTELGVADLSDLSREDWLEAWEFAKQNATPSKPAPEGAATPTVVRPPAPPAIKGVRKDWVYEIEDINAIPRGYLMVNNTAVMEAIRTGTKIPGIKSWQKESIR